MVNHGTSDAKPLLRKARLSEVQPGLAFSSGIPAFSTGTVHFEGDQGRLIPFHCTPIYMWCHPFYKQKNATDLLGGVTKSYMIIVILALNDATVISTNHLPNLIDCMSPATNH